MVTAQEGLLTSNNTGSYAATGGTGERVLIDYKDALVDYRTTDIPVINLFTERMTTDTGGFFSLPWADLNGPSGPNMPAIPNTVHAVIWNNLIGANEIQSYDPSTGMMTGNTALSAASDAV